jgi:peptide/nickel transport system permease protein
VATAVAGGAAAVPEATEWENPEQIGLWQDAWMRFRRNRVSVVGLGIVAILSVIALVIPIMGTRGYTFLPIHLNLIADPLHQDVTNIYVKPGGGHLLGTDELGRDVLARILYGSQISWCSSSSW